MVALAHESIITLWDVVTNVLLHELDDPVLQYTENVGFAGPEGRYLVATGTSTGIAVWDLLSYGRTSFRINSSGTILIPILIPIYSQMGIR